jgi:hypothetical protein
MVAQRLPVLRPPNPPRDRGDILLLILKPPQQARAMSLPATELTVHSTAQAVRTNRERAAHVDTAIDDGWNLDSNPFTHLEDRPSGTQIGYARYAAGDSRKERCDVRL